MDSNAATGGRDKQVKEREYRPRITRAVGLLVTVLVGALVVYLFVFPGSPLKRKLFHSECVANLKGLRKVLVVYSKDFLVYPTAQKWCDLLVENYGTEGGQLFDEKVFVCKSASAKGDGGRCHYAINPNCRLNSPGDTVLLFETTGGWNQYGGAEILTLDNHGGKGCCVLFNDGRVGFVAAEEVGRLRW